MSPGYYWVKILTEWRIGQLVGGEVWQMHGTTHEFKLRDFDQIGKRIKEPK